MTPDELKEMCAQWWADRLEIPEKRDEFKAALLPVIDLDLMKLSVEYDPHGVLLEAVRSVGINCPGFMFSARGILPFKTRMKIRDGIVTVCEGYGAPYERIGL